MCGKPLGAASMSGSAGRRSVRRHATLVVGLALLTGIAGDVAAQPADPAASGAVVRLFTGGRVIVGDGRVIEDAAFLVRGDVIVRVGNAGEVPAPPAASVVDLTGRTVMPALVNTHAHLGWEKYTSWGSENFTRENLVDHLLRHAYYGVGTIISTGSDREEIALEVRQAQRVGEVAGARYLVSPGMGIPGGGPNPRFTNDAGWWGLHGVSSPAEAREVVRAEAARGIRILKIWVDARDERRGARVKLHPDIYAAILDEAQVQDIRVIAHATTLEDHKRLIAAGVRRFIHMPYDVAVDDEYLKLVAARNVFIVPTIGMATRREPYRRPVYEDPFFQEQVPDEVVTMLRDAAAGDSNADRPRTAADEARARRIRSNFLRLRDHVILGTDAGALGDFFGYADHLELELFVRLGMTSAEAIVTATSRAARAFGLETGSIEAGRPRRLPGARPPTRWTTSRTRGGLPRFTSAASRSTAQRCAGAGRSRPRPARVRRRAGRVAVPRTPNQWSFAGWGPPRMRWGSVGHSRGLCRGPGSSRPSPCAPARTSARSTSSRGPSTRRTRYRCPRRTAPALKWGPAGTGATRHPAS